MPRKPVGSPADNETQTPEAKPDVPQELIHGKAKRAELGSQGIGRIEHRAPFDFYTMCRSFLMPWEPSEKNQAISSVYAPEAC